MEQLSFLDKPVEEQVFEAIKPSLIKILEREAANANWLEIKENRSYYSVICRGIVVFRLHDGKNPWISLKDEYAKTGPSTDGQKSNGWTKYKLLSLFELTSIEYMPWLQDVLKRVLEDMPYTFGCCSRYAECSDYRHCVHQDKDFAFDCAYRRNLTKGRIFYGRNKTE